MLTALISTLLLSSGIRSPVACLNGHPTAAAEFQESAATLVGRVLSERAVPDSAGMFEGTRYALRVDEVLRGRMRGTSLLFSENSSGRFPMQVGQRYLVFLYQSQGRWSVDNCGNSGPLPAAAATLAEVRKLQTH